MEFQIKKISKDEFEALKSHGLLDSSKNGRNYYISSQKKKSKRHRYYIVETRKLLEFVKKYREENLQ